MVPTKKEELRNLVTQTTLETYEELTPHLVQLINETNRNPELTEAQKQDEISLHMMGFATVYKGNIIKNLIMDCQSYTKYRPNETTGGIFVSWRRKEELPTGA